MTVNVVVAGVPYAYQGEVEDGIWLTDAHREMILSAAPDVRLEHPSVSMLNSGVGPRVPPDAVLVETSGTLESWESLPWIVTSSGLSRLMNPQLKLIQSCSAGVEQLVDLVPDGVVLANASGVHAPAIAESVLANILADAKLLGQRQADQEERAWRQLPCRELAGSSVCILGTGHIGVEVAMRARAFGMRTWGISRSGNPVEGFDRVGATAQLPVALADADYLVIAAPLTAETEGLIDAAMIAAMKPGGYIANVARGAILDDDAFVSAVRSGHLRGGFLDCHVDEPLPAQSPLWTLPGVVISPHDSHASQLLGDRQVALFAENLRRLDAGEPIVNRVEVERGY